MAFQAWWIERIETENLSEESANKDFTQIGKMIKKVSDLHDLALPRRFEGLRFQTSGNRPPFSTKHIREVILADGALGGLNADARAVLYVMVELGARPSETSGPRPEDIRLDVAVPDTSIESYPGSALTTRHSVRMLPLVGIALIGAG